MDLPDVIAHSARLGPIVHLATVAPDGIPHVAPVHVDWHDRMLYCAVGRSSAKVHNAAANPSVCLHHQVTADSGWDSLMVWGVTRLLTSSSHKHELWSVMSYDLNLFSPGGPDNSPETIFIEIKPSRALFLARFGFDGRSEWRAG
ncbi:MAG: pyridoxamine 5'-phosphate oxidase family protein [Acidimicrobiia bacterium]|nr:pyridoxamine 5'-phosphate oxidase family protein [Acidimicrobiia bacterium]